MVIEFEKVVETGLRKTLNDSVKRFPPNATDIKSQMAYIKLELFRYTSSIRNNPVFTEVLSDIEIHEIIEKSKDKVMNDISKHFNY